MSINNIYGYGGATGMPDNFQQVGQTLSSGGINAGGQDFTNIAELLKAMAAKEGVGHKRHNNLEALSSNTAQTPASGDNIVGVSVKTAVSRYLANSISGALGVGGPVSGIIGGILGSLNISI